MYIRTDSGADARFSQTLVSTGIQTGASSTHPPKMSAKLAPATPKRPPTLTKSCMFVGDSFRPPEGRCENEHH